MSNYPDDIRQYNNHPNSPFYEEPPYCAKCGDDLKVTSLDECGKPELSCANIDCIDD